MTCLSDGLLRAKLDGELSSAELHEVETHLASCGDCRRREELARLQAERVSKALATLEPLPGERPAEAEMAFARFRARLTIGEGEGKTPALFGRLFARRLRPAWGALALAATLSALLSFAPGRSWAQRILAMLRVQKIAVVTVDPSALSGGKGVNGPERAIEQLLSDNLVVTLSPGEPQVAADADEASQMAGFRIRQITSLPDPPQLKVQGERAFHMTVDRQRLQAILEEAGRPDLQLPDSLDGATIAVHIPKAVYAVYGHCPDLGSREHPGQIPAQELGAGQCVLLVQAPSPTVSVPPDLNLAQIAEAGLQLGGMSAEQAHAFCQTVDWTSTLVLPLPRDLSSYQTVQVDGVQGTLIDLPRAGLRHFAYVLVWVKNGIIYSLTSSGSPEQAVPLADSME